MRAGQHPSAPNVTIDTSLSRLPRLEVHQVPALLDSLGMMGEERRQVISLVSRFAALEKGSQDRAEFAALLEEFRQLSLTAYQQVGKPLFLTFLRQGRERSSR